MSGLAGGVATVSGTRQPTARAAGTGAHAYRKNSRLTAATRKMARNMRK